MDASLLVRPIDHMVDFWVQRKDAMKMSSRAGQTATTRDDQMALATCWVC